MIEVARPTEALSNNHVTPTSAPVLPDSQWKTTKPVPLNRESFLDLLGGRTPLIKMPQFITDEQSQRLLDHLLPIFSPYLHATGPPVQKVGVAQFEFQAQSQEDFKNRSGDGTCSAILRPRETYQRLTSHRKSALLCRSRQAPQSSQRSCQSRWRKCVVQSRFRYRRAGAGVGCVGCKRRRQPEIFLWDFPPNQRRYTNSL